MTRDDLEARVWHQLTAMACQRITQGEFVDKVLATADAYAAGYAAAVLGEIDNYRRQPEPVIVHLRDDFNTPACRRTGMHDPVLTDTRENVTCRSCRRTTTWREVSPRCPQCHRHHEAA